MKSIMVVGTASHVGKSLITSALCRILSRQGWRVAPFKGQNMALNAYVTTTGAEIGYAQAVQAWAAGVAPQVEMNPILLKPQGDMTSQVILKGRPVGSVKATDYYEQFFEPGWKAVKDSLRRLSDDYDLIVCEGAGSPVEVNLKHRDLTNMRVATHLQCPVILVADIERGGVFAQIVGTLELLEPEERALVKGIIINKFRGDPTIFASGIEWLEQRTGIPVLGVVPWLNAVLPSEDSLSLFDDRKPKGATDITVAVIRFPRISNFTDFDPLEAEASVKVNYVGLQDSLGYPDAVVLPGSKTTIADLIALQKSGMAEAIQKYAAAGGTVMGVCGGFQMLGNMLADPEGIEGYEGRYKALSLLPMRTVITRHKIARQRQVTSNYPQLGLPVTGYEIHQGRTQLTKPEGDESGGPSFKTLFDDPSLGVVDDSLCVWGTYLHGIFDNGPWRRAWLNRLRQQRGLQSLPTGISNYREHREMVLDELADTVQAKLNLEPVVSQL